MTEDHLEFLGKFKAWLTQAPELKLTYGEFYVTKVTVSFDGHETGYFESDDPSWIYYDTEGKS